ncbi:S41 family peptidase [Portibacter marinus]|uniref:S41 family peptidase n=1 Tax=Portibacter marinus TaxID=2898660 RepID=UPI001F300426|nr:S41 family peptidase [Portibacter marinus]
MRIILIFSCFLSLSIATHSQSFSDVISTEEKIFGLSKIWSEIVYNFAFIDKIEFDIDSLYKSTIPKVLEARNNEEYIKVLKAFMKNFDNNKTLILNSQWMYDETDVPAVMIATEKDEFVISRIESKYKDMIPPGSKILSVDGKDPTSNLRGLKNSAVAIEFQTPEGEIKSEAFIRNLNQRFREGEKIELYPTNIRSQNNRFSIDHKDNISIVTITSFSDSVVVSDFREIIPEVNKSAGLIIDVSNNGGGNGQNAIEIAKHLVERPFIVGPSWKTRIHNAAKKAFGGSRHQGYEEDPSFKENQDFYNNIAYEVHHPDTIVVLDEIEKIKVPIIVIQSNKTISAAEDFLIYIMGNNNIKTIGQRSKGNSGQPLRFDLSNGVAVSIVAKRDALPNGDDYIGLGIKPDIEISEDIDPIEYSIKIIANK